MTCPHCDDDHPGNGCSLPLCPYRAKSNPPAGGEGKPEPVAWRVKNGDRWTLFETESAALDFGRDHAMSVHPLFSAPLSRSGDSALVEAPGIYETQAALDALATAIGLLQLAATYLPITPLADKIADRIDEFLEQHGERK